jgi:hypothetical protein
VAAVVNANTQGGTVPVVLTVVVHNVEFVSVSVNVTVPDGSVAPVKAGVITAEKLTGWFTTEDAGRDDVKPTVVIGWLTVSPSGLALFELD